MDRIHRDDISRLEQRIAEADRRHTDELVAVENAKGTV